MQTMKLFKKSKILWKDEMGMKKKICLSARCPECFSRRFHIIITKRGFSLDKAATGAILGGFCGNSGLGLAMLLGIDGEERSSYLQCDVCGHIWQEMV